MAVVAGACAQLSRFESALRRRVSFRRRLTQSQSAAPGGSHNNFTQLPTTVSCGAGGASDGAATSADAVVGLCTLNQVDP
jgi:hypothetical protein